MVNGRHWFDGAADGFLEAVQGVRTDDLDRPGLGVWDLRGLLGHASRAFATIETYLGAPPGETLLASPSEYFAAARAALADPAQVAVRGRQAGDALGPDPVGAIRTLATRVRTLVEATADDAMLATPVGAITLANYLPTRAFELTVHGIDIARATGRPIPSRLAEVVPHAIALATAIAAPAQQHEVLLAITGRDALPEGFTVL